RRGGRVPARAARSGGRVPPSGDSGAGLRLPRAHGSASVSSMRQVSEDYADLFCALFDGIDAADFNANGERWLLDRKLQAAAAEVEAATLMGERVEVPHPFAALLGRDAALARANPLLGGPAPPALSEYALRYAESG